MSPTKIQSTWSENCPCTVCQSLRRAVETRKWPTAAFKKLGASAKEEFRRLYFTEMVQWDTFKPEDEP